jgi:P27 family predicted phage terminase small subunit
MMDTTPPPSLPGRYRPAWRQIILDLRAAGTLNRATPTTVQALAVATHQWQEATELIEQTGTVYDDHGTPRTSPAVQVQNASATTIARLSRQLGLNRPAPGEDQEHNPPGNPPARTRPAVPKPRRREPMSGCFVCAEGRHDEPWYCEEHKTRHGTCHKHGGLPCHAQLGPGLNTCRSHGGRGSNLKVAAAKAARARGHWEPIEVHPAVALLGEVAWWAGQCAWLDAMVGGLQAGDMVWGMVRRQDVQGGEFPGATVIEEATLNTWIAWQQKSHTQLAQVCRFALESEAEGRMVRLAEAQGAHAFAAFQLGLRRLDLSPGQWEAARQVMPEVLKALTAA